VFDGKPPIEKKELLIKRRQDKQAAEDRYNLIKQEADEVARDDWKTRQELEKEMDVLKKQFVRVTDKDIKAAKQIMTAYGITYFESCGESDQLCVYLVKHNYAWACVSDDMDMFLYGCPRVLRHVSLLNHDLIIYDTEKILADLDMKMEEFRDIAVLSGTDYNIKEGRTLSEMICVYMKYLEYVHYYGPTRSFREWMIQNGSIENVGKLDEICQMFDIDTYSERNKEEIKRVIDCMPFRLGSYQLDNLKEVLREDGFIFV